MDQPNHRHSYYTYGWSGLLSKKAREAESEQFLTELEKLCADLRARNITPKIRLIGFSHGGNLCMQLAHAQQRLQKDSGITIDELILIGTPILSETESALNDPLLLACTTFIHLQIKCKKRKYLVVNFLPSKPLHPRPMHRCRLN